MRAEDPFFALEYAGETALTVALPDIRFETVLTLELGGVTARLFHSEAPYTEDAVCVYIPEEKVLFLGDATSEDFFNGGCLDLQKLRKLTDMICVIDCEFCILGHAEPLRKEDLLAYLHTLLSMKNQRGS